MRTAWTGSPTGVTGGIAGNVTNCQNMMGATLPGGKTFWMKYALLGYQGGVTGSRFFLGDAALQGTTYDAPRYGPTIRVVLAVSGGASSISKIFKFDDPGVKFVNNPIICTTATEYYAAFGGYLE